MPLDGIGEGCIKVLFRILFEAFPEWFLHAFWVCCMYIGSWAVWLVTFGRVWMLDEYENWAGVIGLLVTIALSVCLFQVFGS